MIKWSGSYIYVKYLLKLCFWIFCTPRGMTSSAGQFWECTDSCKAVDGSLFIRGGWKGGGEY